MKNISNLTHMHINVQGQISIGVPTTDFQTGINYFQTNLQIKEAIGTPFFVYNKLNNEFFNHDKEIKENLEYYLEQAHITEKIKNLDTPIQLGYLPGRSLDFNTQISHIGNKESLDKQRQYTETFMTMQFYELKE